MGNNDTKAKRRLINNAWKLAIGPTLSLDDGEGRYYAGYVGDKIAIHEKGEGILPRVIAYFPGTDDGVIAASRICDALNLNLTISSTDEEYEKLSIDEVLSFE
jgi:hypothetical protein